MFSEPLLAHAAETSGVHATCDPHPGDDADRDQDDADTDDEKHMVVAARTRRTAILTRGPLNVCALVHKAMTRTGDVCAICSDVDTALGGREITQERRPT